MPRAYAQFHRRSHGWRARAFAPGPCILRTQDNCRITDRESSCWGCSMLRQINARSHPMSSSLDFELDAQISNLELEWRQAYDASIVARAEYQALASNPSSSVEILDMARERLERAESGKSRVLLRIERLEDSTLGEGW